MSLDQQILDEFIDNCRQGDLIKARLVLGHCDQIDPASQRRILYELSKCDDAFALPLLFAIAIQHGEALEKHPMLAESIRDRAQMSPLVLKAQMLKQNEDQVAVIRLSGELQLKEAVPWSIQLLDSTAALSGVTKAAVETLGRLGAESAVETLSRQLSSPDDNLKTAVVDALGQIASGKAIRSLNSLLTSKHAHIRNRAKYCLINIGKTAAEIVAENLEVNDVDLIIHSLNILQSIGNKGSVEPVRRLINNQPADANVRFAAYEALAALPLRRGDYVLAAGLTDSDYSIRLAAARAVDHHLDDSLLNGVANMMLGADKEAEQVARAVLDSQSAELTKGLLDNPFFKRYFFSYYAAGMEGELRSFYRQLLQTNSNNTLQEELDKAEEGSETRTVLGRICAVDDSRMILKVYQSILNELSWEPVLFDKPEEFLEWLPGKEPAAVFTDLNMPGITGIELTQRAREHYSADLLPIIMVTTQNEEADHERAYEVGINEVMLKPFDIDGIRSVLDRFLNTDKG